MEITILTTLIILIIIRIGGDYMRRNMRNMDIKEYAKNKDVRLWMVAEALNMSSAAFSIYLRNNLDESQKYQIITIVDRIEKEGK